MEQTFKTKNIQDNYNKTLGKNKKELQKQLPYNECIYINIQKITYKDQEILLGKYIFNDSEHGIIRGWTCQINLGNENDCKTKMECLIEAKEKINNQDKNHNIYKLSPTSSKLGGKTIKRS